MKWERLRVVNGFATEPPSTENVGPVAADESEGKEVVVFEFVEGLVDVPILTIAAFVPRLAGKEGGVGRPRVSGRIWSGRRCFNEAALVVFGPAEVVLVVESDKVREDERRYSGVDGGQVTRDLGR